jgi:hypothetical protein
MPIDPSLLEIHTHTGPAFQPLVNFQSWRVAVLNFTDHLRPENLHDMQRHDETDEVFVLLRGRCILFIGDGRSEAGQITAVDLKPLTLYNVKQGTWHNHTLSEDASVLVVENRETTLENSPFCELSEDQRRQMVEETAQAWGLK